MLFMNPNFKLYQKVVMIIMLHSWFLA